MRRTVEDTLIHEQHIDSAVFDRTDRSDHANVNDVM